MLLHNNLSFVSYDFRACRNKRGEVAAVFSNIILQQDTNPRHHHHVYDLLGPSKHVYGISLGPGLHEAVPIKSLPERKCVYIHQHAYFVNDTSPPCRNTCLTVPKRF